MTAPAIGLLIPAANRVMEPDFIRWTVPDGLLLHVNRLNAPKEKPADMSENLAALTRGVPEAARLLALARPGVIAFGCTSGSFLHGPEWDEELRQTLSRIADGAPAVTTASALVRGLAALGARRLAVISPYPAAVGEIMLRYLRAQGLDVVEAIHADDDWQPGSMAAIEPATVARLARGAAFDRADACLVSCTNLRAAEALLQIEAETGKPVVASNQATYWACLRALGRTEMLPALGRLGAC